MTDHLSHLTLFKDVKITRDYSVVHDMSPETWRAELIGNEGNKNIVLATDIVYYRLPDDIYIECSYDEVRKASYGMVDIWRGANNATRTYFFWIDEVKLTRSSTADGLDTVCLKITEDTWSNWFSYTDLKDTYIVRKHMPRWNGSTPIYYPNAAQGVDGSFTLEKTVDITPPKEFSGGFLDGKKLDMRYIIVNALINDNSNNGVVKMLIGCDAVDQDGYVYPVRVYGDPSERIFSLKDVLDGDIYRTAGFTADFVQSITVVPYLGPLNQCLRYYETGSTQYLYFDETSVLFESFSIGGSRPELKYITLNFGIDDLDGMMSKIVTVVDPVAPEKETVAKYSDKNEPMLYLSPARIRKAVNGMGGAIMDVPDIAAFRTDYTVQNSFDLTGAVTFVYAGSSIAEANAIGALGTAEAATLPIFNSAWKTYEAIQKAGDERVYEAQQWTAGLGMTVGIATGVAAIFTGGATAALGGIMGGSSAASGASSMYLNDEQMRAKRATIRNSPCTVVSTGSGLGAYVLDLIDLQLMVLKIDPVSYRKLQEQYYFYGYFVGEVARGSVNLWTRTKFDFVQTSGARVTGDVPGDARNTIAMIFDKGVTIYHGRNGYQFIGTGMEWSNDESTPTSGAVNG